MRRKMLGSSWIVRPPISLHATKCGLATIYRRSLETHSYSLLASRVVHSAAASQKDDESHDGRQPVQHSDWSVPEMKSPSVELPSGKKCFVFNAKRDQDGELEPVLCFVDSQGKRLMWMDGEELHEFEKLIPRLEEYCRLHGANKHPFTAPDASAD